MTCSYSDRGSGLAVRAIDHQAVRGLHFCALLPLFRRVLLPLSPSRTDHWKSVLIQPTGSFVEMGSDQEAQAAIQGLNEKEQDGRPLTVNEA